MTAIPNAEDGVEAIWTMLSLLCLPVSRQLEILGPLPNKDASEDLRLFNNGAYLLRTLEEYLGAWRDEFEENPSTTALCNHVLWMDRHTSEEDFLNSARWHELRSLARLALAESTLPPWPIGEYIDFNRYIEIVLPEDLKKFR